jgi:hypothetical protein
VVPARAVADGTIIRAANEKSKSAEILLMLVVLLPDMLEIACTYKCGGWRVNPAAAETG